MKKICFVTTTSVTLETFVLETAKYINKHEKIEITFICDHNEEFSKKLPKYIKYYPISMKRGISFSGIFTVFKLISFFNKEKFDVIQYSTPNAALYASIAGFLTKIPIRLYCQWGIRYVGLEGIKRKIFRVIEKMTCNFSTDIRAVSRKNLEFAVKEKLYRKEKAKIIGEGGTIGVDLTLFDISKKDDYRKEIRNRYGICDEFLFGFVGRLSRDKGANELLEAFRDITKVSKAKLFIIGSLEIDKTMSLELMEWAKKSEDVIFTGSLEKKELVKYYAALDCYVHPTYREGFGMVIQEAGAMGCPIITTDIPGAGEVMIHNESCLLVEARERGSLFVAMKKIINDEKSAKKISENARRRTEKYFCRKKMLENQLKDYNVLGIN